MSEPSVVEIFEDMGVPSGASYSDLLRHVARMPEDTPAVYFEGKTITYAELARQVAGAVRFLESSGLGRGSHVAYLLKPRPAALVSWLAVTVMGGVLIPLYIDLSGDVLGSALRRLDVEAVLTEPDRVDELRSFMRQDSPLQHVIGAADSAYSVAMAAGADPGPILARDYPKVTDIAVLLSTSGTTGMPKGVEFTQAYASSGAIARRKWGIEGPVKAYVCTSWGHGLVGFVASLAFWSGGSLVISPRFSASRFWAEVAQHQCDYVQLIGTMPQMLMAQAPTQFDRGHSVRYLLTTGMPPSLWTDFEERFGVPVWEFYSGTDVAGGFLSNPGRYPKGAIGRPWAEYEAKVVSEDGSPVPVGEKGLLVMRPKGGRAVVTYYRDPEASAAKVTGDGWVLTGDLVRQDEGGNFYFIDRARDIIRRRGVNIAPAAIEEALAACPGIEDVAAFGVPSELGEDEVKVVGVVDGSNVRESDISEFAAATLPSYMRPRYIEIVDSLPRTPGTAKIQRYRLRTGWRTSRTWDVATQSHLSQGAHHGAQEGGSV
jgi:carnitine-CoA ligase